ncbi:DUF427 domain-containing protein [Notoacmeibacter marinus]|uniref:DUF427 domain-containing protein n=1 Tax=Notoacmeibacter marinus TaxID=1876515 RepID=UPI000DF351E5|nr:DUF427 domain-containing protein [Notoacmeibacter marinus]
MSNSPYIRIDPLGRPITVKFRDAVVASSENALSLKEGDYPAVVYIPRDDVYFEHLTRVDTTSHCPHKGDAVYFRLSAAGEAANEAAWSYETPKAEVGQIAGHVAFYPDHVTIEQG